MIRLLLASLILTLGTSYAQGFFFVSSRTQVEGDIRQAEDWEKNQNEIFIYKNGSEIRFTHTNDLSEYDPSISPNGSYIAYAATSWVYPTALEQSQWKIFVEDLRGRAIAELKIPNSRESMRPAGGFVIAWKADSSGFFYNANQADGYDWDVYYFDLNSKTSKKITYGFMPIISPDYNLMATGVDGMVRIYDLGLDESWALVFKGIALAWYDNTHLFVQDDDTLLLVDVYKPEERNPIHHANAYYVQLVMNENSEYAFFVHRDTGSSLYKYLKRNELLSIDFSGFIREIALQNDGSIIYSLQEDDSINIYKIDNSGKITPLISSFGSDFSPTLIKK